MTEPTYENRLKAEKEVEELRKREERGQKAPTISQEELAAERNARENIVEIGDAIKPMLAEMQKLAEKTKKFGDRLRKKLQELPPVHCERHKGVVRKVDADGSFSESWKANELVPVYMECEECKEERDALLVNERWIKMGIPVKVSGATFDSYIVGSEGQLKALNKARDQIAKGGFMIFRGAPGTGKSHLAAACIKQVGSGIFITLADLVGQLRGTYEGVENIDHLVARYRSCACLVIDELDEQVKGVDIQPFLYRILAHRYDRNLPNVITSNETLNTILDIIGPRLTDRVRANYTVATMEWESYRKQK